MNDRGKTHGWHRWILALGCLALVPAISAQQDPWSSPGVQVIDASSGSSPSAPPPAPAPSTEAQPGQPE